nr:uncharacterized protein LOC106686191 [Halyomorpha halys]
MSKLSNRSNKPEKEGSLSVNESERREQEEEEEHPTPCIKFVKPKGSNNVDEVTFYFTRRKIGDLMLFMMQHVLINEPDDPVGFLQQLMDKCLMFRSGILCSPPLLFEDRHIASLYSSFDPLGMGSISRKQYHVGLQTLGLKKNQYDMEPELEEGSVKKETFLLNAKMALVESFMDMILLPPTIKDDESSLETFYH